MADPLLPDTLGEVLDLAAIIVFLLTSLSALLSALLIKRDNLFYLGFQLIGLTVALIFSRDWLYDMTFSAALGSAQTYHELTASALILSIAYTVDMGLKVLVWERILRRNGRAAVPPLLIAVVRFLVYLVGGLTILQFVYGQSITAIATLSGAFAIVLGLSAQSTLGEMFAGIAIALSRPFRIGDWIKVGHFDEGKVVDMTWRLVRLEMRDRSIVNLTNRMCADSPIKNFSYPNDKIRLSEDIYFPRGYDQERVKKAIRKAIAAVPTVLADPAPNAVFMSVRDGVDHYAMRFYIREYNIRRRIVEQVWRSVTAHLDGAGIPIAQPREVVDQHQAPPAQDSESAAKPA
ncbi:MAG: mechanosensitive ion channel [Alphaproteobacteria bacterium]|nr:mechanosensitive ion channel [Alphaproteobacteria bacterium]